MRRIRSEFCPLTLGAILHRRHPLDVCPCTRKNVRPDATLSPFDAGYVAVSPELSTNYELGMRSAPLKGVQLEATLFRIDFKNQIVPGQSLGLGQTFANGG
jgi:outer membrane receptor for Fe3+-dicitrate